MKISTERQRLANDGAGTENWRLSGPYLSERQWGTVREDYSASGAAWDYLLHDHARSRAYRWGEDGIAGFSDDRQYLCLSLALWNGKDPMLKERLFGLTNSEGNHGEDVKELYYYLDATPSHSYLKMLYKYPQAVFPYSQLREENRRRGLEHTEFELLDTGLFDDDRYFDVFVEYAKASPDDILMQITAYNRGPGSARLTLLPQLCCRNIWSWELGVPKPKLIGRPGAVEIQHADLGRLRGDFDSAPTLLFCDNDTNSRRLLGMNETSGYFKDGFHEYLVGGRCRSTISSSRRCSDFTTTTVTTSRSSVRRGRENSLPCMRWPRSWGVVCRHSSSRGQMDSERSSSITPNWPAIRTSATTFYSTSTFMATRDVAWARLIRRAGRDSSPSCCNRTLLRSVACAMR